MNFKNNILPLENKIHIFAPPCNILYIIHSFHKIKIRERTGETTQPFVTIFLKCGLFKLGSDGILRHSPGNQSDWKQRCPVVKYIIKLNIQYCHDYVNKVKMEAAIKWRVDYSE